MGLFSGMNNTLKKSVAAEVVQGLLERQARAGLFDPPPAAFANHLVQTVWNHRPETFNGKEGPRPHKIAIAAMALCGGIGLMNESDLNRYGLILALGHLLDDVQRNGGQYSFNGLDHTLLERAATLFQQVAEASDGDLPFGA